MKIKTLIKNILPYGIINPMVKKKIEYLSSSLRKESFEPIELFNENGEKVYQYFLEDVSGKHIPRSLTYGRQPTRILWDRYHYELKYHFYSGEDIARTKGQPVKKFAIQTEAKSITSKPYEIFIKNPSYAKEFELIFTSDERELDLLPNAVFFNPMTVWIGTPAQGGTLDETRYFKKTKNLSMVASNKILTQNHVYRIETAKRLKKMQLADTFGKFDGGQAFAHMSDALEDYRFQVVVENENEPYGFTEKILNCFATMTIPLYYGAQKIDKFFNIDGIVVLSKADLDNIEQIVKKICNEQFYEERIEAVKDNFQRSLDYLSVEDRLLKYYGDKICY